MDIFAPAALVVLTLIGLAAAVVTYRWGLFRGIGVAAVCSLLLPTWLKATAFGISADLRVCVSIAAIFAATLFRPQYLFNRLVLADILIAFLCVWQAFSEWNATGSAVEPFLLSYGFWILPYLVGRCSARSVDDLRWLGYCVIGVCGVFAIAGLVENTVGTDLFETVFGTKPGLQFHTKKAMRWGFIRCEGPYTHPIFFGTVNMLLLPWSVWLASLTTEKRAFAVAGTGSAVVATVNSISRGPALGVLIAFLTATLVRFRKTSIALTTIGFLGAIVLLARPEYLKDATTWFAEASGERERPVAFDGELQENSSSLSRLLIVEHYWKSVTHAGIIGYGMTATDMFPPNVPHIPFDQVTRKQFPIVDNTYVLLALRGGWLLCLGFVLLLVTAMFQFYGLEKQEPSLKVLCRMMIGAMCAFALVVFTVYPDFDFMFVFLWTVGISSIRLEQDDATQ
ncbi:MAG: O-antigen ligase family protein [Planctomycetaceae bacterium]